MAPGFLGVRKGRRVAMVGPAAAPSAASRQPPRAGAAPRPRWRPCRAPWILRAPAFCPGVTSLFPSGEQWGKAPHPPFPPCLPLLAVVSKQESSLFTECPTASGSARWPLHRAPAPTPVGSQPRGRPLLFPGVLLHLPGLRRHSSVTGFRIPWVCLLFSLRMSQSPPLPKVCDSKQLLLLSVSHWCGSLRTVKRPTSGC